MMRDWGHGALKLQVLNKTHVAILLEVLLKQTLCSSQTNVCSHSCCGMLWTCIEGQSCSSSFNELCVYLYMFISVRQALGVNKLFMCRKAFVLCSGMLNATS